MRVWLRFDHLHVSESESESEIARQWTGGIELLHRVILIQNSFKDSSLRFILDFLFIRDYCLATILLAIVKVQCVTHIVRSHGL